MGNKINTINKIVIVGGGSAGWMSAAALIKTFPNKEIVLIESPDIPIVGVGESTLGGIKNYCHYIGIDEKDFMSYTNASYKMSIRFTDFYKKDSGSFHYPFGEPFFDNDIQRENDWFIKKAHYPETPTQDFVRCLFPAAALFENNKFALNKYGVYDNYNPRIDVAYHFDAVRFGGWLREKYCIPRGVKHIQAEVSDVSVSESGIEYLVLKNKEKIKADLFIDCTGFSSILLGKALKEPFISFSNILPNNRAWACQVPYIDKEKEIEPFTNCTALGNGWAWNVPLWSRLGTGYVYSDNHISPEDALEEFKDYLCSDKMAVKRKRKDIEKISFKDIRMRTGIHERTWVKNVVAIGLSAAFIEPLESNGLFSVHEFLFKLLKSLLRGEVSQWDRDAYNAATYGLFRNFTEFVALHYALSHRDDTQYWRDIKNHSFAPGMVRQEPTNIVGFYSLQDTKMFSHRYDHNSGINYISVGMNYCISDEIDQAILKNKFEVDVYKEMKNVFIKMEERKARWEKAAQNEKTLYQYLKENIYEGQE